MDHKNAQDELFILSDGNGQEMSFHFLDLVLYEGKEYLVLLPAEGPYIDEVVILRHERGERPEDEGYEGVEDPATIQAVYSLFRENNRDQFIFGD